MPASDPFLAPTPLTAPAAPSAPEAPALTPSPARARVAAPLLRHLRPHAGALAAGALCVLAGSAATAAQVPLARHAATVFGDLSLGALNQVVLGLVGLYALKGLFGFGASALAARVALETTASLREEIYAHLLGLSLRAHRRFRSTDLASRLVQDLGLFKDALHAALADVLPSVVVIAYALGYIVWLNWHLAAFTFVAMPLVAWAIGAFGSRLQAIAEDVQARVSDLFARAHEGLSGLVAIQAFGREADEARRFARANRAHRDAQWRASWVSAIQPPTIAFLQTAAMGAVLWVGGVEITQGRLASADLLAFAAAIAIAIDPTLALSHAWGRLQQARGAVGRVTALLEETDRLPSAPDAAPLGPVAGALTVEGLRFGYGPERPVLDGIELAVAPGEVLALVGPSGGGKTTLAHLLLRLEDPDAGAVRLDGRDLREIPPSDLRRAIAYVAQDALLFEGSVAENVAFGAPDASPDAIVEACRAAEADAFIRALPQGYDTPLGERGAGLSGGQRQRLALARALLADPRVLILDEATSALDNQAEEAVRRAIAALMRGRTTVIIAHRLSAIEHADRIAVLDGGRLVEHGTREALWAQNGLFRRLAEAGSWSDEPAASAS